MTTENKSFWKKLPLWLKVVLGLMLIGLLFEELPEDKSTEYSTYIGRYVFDNGIDTKGELIITHNGTFSGQHTDYYGNQLVFLSGRLDGQNVVFTGFDESQVKVSGTIAGNLISVHWWTSLYGDNYLSYYKTDHY